MSAITDNLHTTLGPFAAAVLRKAGATVPIEKCKAMRLRPIPWGKPDKELGDMVLTHMVAANPPVVIAWSVHQPKIIRYLTHVRAQDTKVEDLYNLIAQRFPDKNTP